MQPEILNQLKSELQSKCVAYDYVDATDNALSEFFINLVLVNKTMEEVNEELIQLVGSDYNPNLTTWFFERKAELENPKQHQQIQEQQQQMQAQQQELQEQQRQIQEQQQQVQQEQAQQQQQQQPEDENMDITPRTAKADRQNRMFTKAIGSVIGNHEKPSRARSPPPPRRSSRSRSRSPTRQSSRYSSDRHGSRREDRHFSRRQDDRHEEDRGRSGNIFSRLGGSSSQSNKSGNEKPSVFDRLGGVKPAPNPTQTAPQERCKYWPNCKNGDECTYVHPSTVCPDFPNCPKTAMECLYIHPEVAKPVAMQPQIKKLPVPCKFFPYCTNPVCPFIHPVPAHQPFFMQAKPSFATTGQRVQIPCKNGDDCTRPDCHFLHPKDPNPQAEIVCKFDGACTRPNCFYKHTKENKFNNGKQENTNARQFSVAEDEVVERIHVGESADMIQTPQQNATEQQQQSSMDMDSDVVMDVN